MNIDISKVEAVGLAAAKAGAPFLEPILATLSSTVAGPFGPMVLNSVVFPLINKALGLDADTDPATTAAAIEADPQAADKLNALQENHQFQLALEKQNQDYQVQSQAQQVQINTTEAENPSWFVAGWRPMIGWGLGGFLMVSTGLPYLAWAITVITGHVVPQPPMLDNTAYATLAGILGVTVAARSYDKSNGTEMKAIGGKTVTTKVTHG